MSDESDVEYSDITAGCARFILNSSCSGLPVKKPAVVKYIKGTEGPKAATGAIIKNAGRMLKEIYGYKLTEIPTTGGNVFILTLLEPSSEGDEMDSTPPKIIRILNLTLAHIFMSGGSVEEELMWEFLDKADALTYDNMEDRKILTQQFTRQMYLKYEKVKDTGTVEHFFKWGERASLEMPKMYFLEKIAAILEKSPESFPDQYSAALADSEKREASQSLTQTTNQTSSQMDVSF